MRTFLTMNTIAFWRSVPPPLLPLVCGAIAGAVGLVLLGPWGCAGFGLLGVLSGVTKQREGV
jgi:hypothetical protein